MLSRRVLTKLSHLSKNGDPFPAGASLAQCLKRCNHRVGVGVVSVIVDEDSGTVQNLHPFARGFELHEHIADAANRNVKGKAYGGGSQGIGCVMLSRNLQLNNGGSSLFQRSEPKARTSALIKRNELPLNLCTAAGKPIAPGVPDALPLRNHILVIRIHKGC